MKNPKLFKHGEAFIVSMEALIKRYEAAIEEGISKLEYERYRKLDCLLCNPIGIENNHTNSYNSNGSYTSFEGKCRNLGCPWMVILGVDCSDFAVNDDDYYAVYTTEDPKVMKRRIRQIKNWIKIYKKYMEEIQ